MNLEKYLDITPELQEAIKNGEPVVALESTILSHGMPYPETSPLPQRWKKRSGLAALTPPLWRSSAARSKSVSPRKNWS